MQSHLSIALVASLVCAVSTANADRTPTHSWGGKLLFGTDQWSAPSDAIMGEELGFGGKASGFGYGVLGYYEWEIARYIGFEVDLAYQHGSFHRETTWVFYPMNSNSPAGSVSVRESVSIPALRLPLLAKLQVPLGYGSLWIGGGPEFTLFQDSSVEVKQLRGPALPFYAFRAKDGWPVYGTAGAGFVLRLPGTNLEIPVEARVSRNLTQPESWNNRVSINVYDAIGYDVKAQSTWVMRIGAGLGYRF